jgi:hypothetical protein
LCRARIFSVDILEYLSEVRERSSRQPDLHARKRAKRAAISSSEANSPRRA